MFCSKRFTSIDSCLCIMFRTAKKRNCVERYRKGDFSNRKFTKRRNSSRTLLLSTQNVRWRPWHSPVWISFDDVYLLLDSLLQDFAFKKIHFAPVHFFSILLKLIIWSFSIFWTLMSFRLFQSILSLWVRKLILGGNSSQCLTLLSFKCLEL